MSKKAIALILSGETCLCACVWLGLGQTFGICFTLALIGFQLLIAGLCSL